MKKLDKNDYKILSHLDIDGRMFSSQIAKKLRLAKETFNYRIKKLIDNEVIKRFNTLVNASLMGYEYYRIYIKFHKLTPKIEKDILEYLITKKNCSNLRFTEGTFDLSFFSINLNLNELKEFLQEFSENFGRYLLQKNIHTIYRSYKLNQKFLFDPGRFRTTIIHEKRNEIDVDTIDLKIIKALAYDGRKKITDIAKETKINAKIVNYRLKELSRKKIIIGHYPELNLHFFGRDFVQIDMSLKNLNSISSIIEYFDSTKTCLFATELIGQYDLSVEIYVKNDHELREIILDFRKKFFNDYLYYDVSTIYREFITNWSPFEEYSVIKNGIIVK